MEFLDPKNDYAFKRIFGSDHSKEILLSFLNCILYQEQEVITDLVIINPHNLGTTYTLKDTFLDVKAKLKNNTTVLIEMQLLNRYAFNKRVIYNAAKTYANQLDVGEQYFLLEPVIALTIADFILFKNSLQIINSFVFKEETQNFNYQEEIKLVFVELPKFKNTIEELNTLVEKWLFFLKNAQDFTEKPPILEENNMLNKALEISNLATVSKAELEEIQKRQMWLVDQLTINRYAREEGREEGIEQGIEQGVEIGAEKMAKKMINRSIKRQLGEISSDSENRINQLSINLMEDLALDLMDFKTENDLINWLNNQDLGD